MNEVVPSTMRGGLVELHAVFFILGFAVAAWVGFCFSFWIDLATSNGILRTLATMSAGVRASHCESEMSWTRSLL